MTAVAEKQVDNGVNVEALVGAREALTHQRCIGNGRPVGEAALGPQTNAAVRDAGNNAGGTEDCPVR